MIVEKVWASIDSTKFNYVRVSSINLENLSADCSCWLDCLMVAINVEKQVVHVFVFILVVSTGNVLDLAL